MRIIQYFSNLPQNLLDFVKYFSYIGKSYWEAEGFLGNTG